MQPHEVFKPHSQPDVTYVEPSEGQEKDLKRGLRQEAAIITLAGPSKSGKTVLTRKVADELGYELHVINGSEISEERHLGFNFR